MHRIFKRPDLKRECISILMIIVGCPALITPFTSGSWLLPIGIAGLIGRERAQIFFVKILG